MGFDLSGCNAKNEKGDYFRNNVWWWRPLWNYVCINCDKTLNEKEKEAGGWNNGSKIPAFKAEKIATKLKETIDSGKAKTYEKEYKKHLKELALVDCMHCSGSGKIKKKKCKICNGKGLREERHFTISCKISIVIKLKLIQPDSVLLLRYMLRRNGEPRR